MGPEAKLEKKFKDKVKKAGAISFKFVSPGHSGATDRLVLIPGGAVVFVEIKVKGGRLSPLQIQFARILEFYKAQYEVIWCEEDIDKFIDKYCWQLL